MSKTRCLAHHPSSLREETECRPGREDTLLLVSTNFCMEETELVGYERRILTLRVDFIVIK
jgi:hypothetical protein